MPLISERPEMSTTGRSRAVAQRGEEIGTTRQNLTAVRGQHLNRFVECSGPEIQAVAPHAATANPRAMRGFAVHSYTNGLLCTGEPGRPCAGELVGRFQLGKPELSTAKDAKDAEGLKLPAAKPPR